MAQSLAPFGQLAQELLDPSTEADAIVVVPAVDDLLPAPEGELERLVAAALERRPEATFYVVAFGPEDVPAPHVLDPEGTNLARLLIESNRIGEARAIEEEFQRLADEAAGRVRATVTTAIELDRSDRDRVQQQLSKRLDKEVRLSVVVDPGIIGGLKPQYGDRVVDATVATRLQQLRRRLAAT